MTDLHQPIAWWHRLRKKLAGPDLRSSPTQAETHKIYFLYPSRDHQPSSQNNQHLFFSLNLVRKEQCKVTSEAS